MSWSLRDKKRGGRLRTQLWWKGINLNKENQIDLTIWLNYTLQLNGPSLTKYNLVKRNKTITLLLFTFPWASPSLIIWSLEQDICWLKLFIIVGPNDELPRLGVLWGGRWPPHHYLPHEDSVRQHLHPTNKWVLTSSQSSQSSPSWAQTNIHCIWHRLQWFHWHCCSHLLLIGVTPITSSPSWAKSKTNGFIQFLKDEILISDIIVSNYFHQPEVKFPGKILLWRGGLWSPTGYNCKTGG